ncbi:hypothetical protein FLONG3_7929 [Fusarium longipes]|uniref:Xylanolytic transcriptional activator regulatory domain-containing protein n=1 Tax=Fusarium longipes TaxID=694270 RepID=A0A395S9J2_9HYPO|nr:hypothetical protein FLONG3_7929 [Fusarium longipes]
MVETTNQIEASVITPMSLTYSPTTTGQSEDSAFHGPAGGTFGADPSKSSDGHGNEAVTLSIKNQLLAEATRQRQLEGVNRRLGKLDFRDVDPDVGMDLLLNFWNRQHYIVYRPAFMRDMSSNGPYFSELLLYAMLFAGSRFTAEAAAARNINEVNATGRRYRAKFEQILHGSGSDILFKSDITTIQALLVVSDSMFSWCNERSLSWHYMGLAINMMIDLGLHIDGPARKSLRRPSAEDTEIERRVFWAAFILDKVQSIYQGRPTRLREHDTAVPIIFLDEYEELEDFTDRTFSAKPRAAGSPTHGVSALEHLCKLSVVMDRILCTLYAERSATQDASDLLESAQDLHSQLESWKESLPDHLRFRLDDAANPDLLPHTLSLMALYNSLIILMYRPFLSEGHLISVSDTAAPEAFLNCAHAALELHHILHIYAQHFCLKTPPYFISYAASCLEILNIQQAWSHGPKRTMKILLELMERLNVQVGDFVALKPINCHEDGSREAVVTSSAPNDTIMTGNIPNSLNFQEIVPNGHADLAMNFQSNGDVALTDFDVDQIMDSFVFPLSTLAHEDLPIPPQQDVSQLGFSQPGVDGGQFIGHDLMVFDDLFGFDEF